MKKTEYSSLSQIPSWRVIVLRQICTRVPARRHHLACVAEQELPRLLEARANTSKPPGDFGFPPFSMSIILPTHMQSNCFVYSVCCFWIISSFLFLFYFHRYFQFGKKPGLPNIHTVLSGLALPDSSAEWQSALWNSPNFSQILSFQGSVSLPRACTMHGQPESKTY